MQLPTQEGSKMMFTIQHVYSPYRKWVLWLASGDRKRRFWLARVITGHVNVHSQWLSLSQYRRPIPDPRPPIRCAAPSLRWPIRALTCCMLNKRVQFYFLLVREIVSVGGQPAYKHILTWFLRLYFSSGSIEPDGESRKLSSSFGECIWVSSSCRISSFISALSSSSSVWRGWAVESVTGGLYMIWGRRPSTGRILGWRILDRLGGWTMYLDWDSGTLVDGGRYLG